MRGSVRRFTAVGAAAALLASMGCTAGRQAAPGSPTAATDQTLNELFNLSAVYQRLGRLAARGPIPFVGNYTTLAGRGDSTVFMVGFSFENRALSFQRDQGSFAARYRVDLTLGRATGEPIAVTRNEVVRVASFQETQRSDESVFFQQAFLLEPGSYNLTMVVRDPASNAASRVERVIEVPKYGAGSMSQPAMVYEVRGRTAPSDSFHAVLNPRGTVSHGGGDTLYIYVEGYRYPGPTSVPVVVKDDRDSVVYRSSVDFAGSRDVEGRVARIAADAPPLGELTIQVGEGDHAARMQALVSFARGWVVTNYDNLLNLLRFFPYEPGLLNALRNAKPADRSKLWRQFWLATDPIPETSENEALDRYFTRVAIANQRFQDEGGEGWRTDRGEVYISLGEPDQIYESPPSSSDRRYTQWLYNEYRVVLYFEGTMGFSRMRLTPNSRAEFARARAMVSRDPQRAR
ncbi:MAG: GWxTD domain-containing protein [Gemmatimonadales bacterium]